MHHLNSKTSFSNSQTLIRSEILRLSKKEKSLRKLAKEMNISHTVLSKFLNGKRLIGFKSYQKVFSNFISIKKNQKILKAFKLEKKAPKIIEPKTVRIDEDEFLSNPKLLILLHIFQLEDFDGTKKYLKDKSGADEVFIKKALIKFEKWGFIQKKDTKVFATDKFILTRDAINHSNMWKEFQKKIFNYIIENNNEKIKFSERYFHSWTVGLDPKDIPSFRSAIREFIKKFHKKSLLSRPKKVYNLYISLFPFSK